MNWGLEDTLITVSMLGLIMSPIWAKVGLMVAGRTGQSKWARVPITVLTSILLLSVFHIGPWIILMASRGTLWSNFSDWEGTKMAMTFWGIGLGMQTLVAIVFVLDSAPAQSET